MNEVQTEECAHHWMVGFEVGIDSPATCKRCGAERRFLNAVVEKTWRVAPCAKCGYSRTSTKHRVECDGAVK